jgi:NADPH:quinone reductase-like Zn-dependent oxidoreductase
LIHSACGGVGISAIQIARHLGAKIYATVGTEDKVQYLMDTFGLERNCIFNSRDASFLQDVMRETDGKGVDLVLNSLSGELLHASWRCVAEFGKMIEIGKTDLLGSGKLDMDVFLANRSYCCVDLDEICSKKPMKCGR